MLKHFLAADVRNPDSAYPRILADSSDLLDAQPEWMKRGLMETASGYGARLNTGRKISFEGKLYRLYATCYGNAASVWFTVKGRKIYVD